MSITKILIGTLLSTLILSGCAGPTSRFVEDGDPSAQVRWDGPRPAQYNPVRVGSIGEHSPNSFSRDAVVAPGTYRVDVQCMADGMNSSIPAVGTEEMTFEEGEVYQIAGRVRRVQPGSAAYRGAEDVLARGSTSFWMVDEEGRRALNQGYICDPVQLINPNDS